MNRDPRLIRRWLLVFILSLFFSGLTAIPLESELFFLKQLTGSSDPGFWFHRVHEGLLYLNTHFPFLGYGYDWLAFAHFLFAILFIGPYRDPYRNEWVLDFGIIACLLIPPFAFIAGSLRGIPFTWQLIDCSFGVFGLIPLMIVKNIMRRSVAEPVRMRGLAG